jgi:hypothetical protein
MARYQAALAAQGMSQPQFEAQLRQDLTLQQLVAAIGDTAIVASGTSEEMLRIQSEERQVAELRFTPEQFAGQVKIDSAALEKYYEENKQRFEVPEQAKADYVVLSLEALMDKVTVSEVEVSAWYEGHKDRYQTAEERAREPHPDPRRWESGRRKGESQSGWHSQGTSGIARQVRRTGQTAFAGSGLCAKRRRSRLFWPRHDGQAL